MGMRSERIAVCRVLDGIGFGGFESPAILVMSNREPSSTQAFFASYPNASCSDALCSDASCSDAVCSNGSVIQSETLPASPDSGFDLALIDSSLSVEKRRLDTALVQAFDALKPSGRILVVGKGGSPDTIRQLLRSLDEAGFSSWQTYLDVDDEGCGEGGADSEGETDDEGALFTLTLAEKPGEHPSFLRKRFRGEALGVKEAEGPAGERPQSSAGERPQSHETRIRPMTEDDLSQVMNIEFAVFSRPWSPLAFALELRSNQHALYLVLEHIVKDHCHDRSVPSWRQGPSRVQQAKRPLTAPYSEIIGYVGLWCSKNEAWITRIAVAPRHVRKGWGTCLLGQAESFALEQGSKTVLLEIRQSNEQASSFYVMNGYRQTGVFRDYYDAPDEDALVFAKNLA
jgi:ribosomal-protein-alanine N-acetyltransferase